MSQLTLVERACPVCGDDRRATLFAECTVDLEALDEYAFASRKTPEYMHWKLWQCGGCDLLYANPLPDLGELASRYEDAAFASSSEAGYASRAYARCLERFLPRLRARGAALDIGTGDGAFLHELRAFGFESIVGLEPSAAPIEAADDSVRSLIRQCLFEPGLFEPESLDLITCFQTIEHVPEPLELCREAWQLLKPGGLLFLVGHNRRALSATILGKRSPIFDLEHMQLFSPFGMRRLLENAGFQSIRIRPLWNRYPLHYWARLFPFPRGVKSRIISFLQRFPFRDCTLALPAGNLAALAFKAPTMLNG